MSYSDWMSYDLFDIAEVKTGKSNTIDAVEDGKYPLFDRSQIIKRSNKYLFDEVAILIPGEGQEFIPRFYKGKFDLHQRVYAVLPNYNIINPKYLYYLMHHHKDTLSKIAVGTTVKSLRLSSFEFLEFKIPSLKIQNIVQQILSNLDEKIELNNKINKTLEELAQTLYKHWFVDFEFPNEEGLPYKSSGGKMVESELGLIPEGWNKIKLDKYLEFERGVEPGAKNYNDTKGKNSLAFIRVGDLNKYNPVYVDKEHLKNKYINLDDILVSFDGAIGRVSIGLEGSYSTGLRKIYSNNKINLTKEYIYYLFKSEEIQNTINNHANGTTILHASSSIKFLETVYNEEVIEKFSKIVNPLFSKIIHIINENQKLANLRDLLLPKLMSGEIRVPIKE